jgi:DNA (cytosine-5)-methyltransferase 1
MFCCQGGASMGYHRAGFEVVGVDVADKRNYPFAFVQGDAIEYLAAHYEQFDLIHASPPCQHFTKYRNRRKDIATRYENLIPQTRDALIKTGKPYIIENVPGAPLLFPIVLCGSMFGLDVRRHRLFEANFPIPQPKCDHTVWEPNRFPGGRSKERGGHARVPCRATVEIGRWNIPLKVQQRAMGIDWIDDLRSLSEAIPPAYTQWLGEAFLRTQQQ